MTTMASPVQQEQTQARTWSRPAGFDVLRIVLGLVLLTAAVLKGWQLATEPTLEKGLLTSRWFLIAGVEVEWLLAVWLLSGLYKRQVWWAALGILTLFSGIALHKTLSGAVSCGCFGNIEIDPWYTLLFDLGTMGLLAVFRPRDAQATSVPAVLPPSRSALMAMTLAAIVSIVIISGAAAMGSYTPAEIDEAGQIIGDGRFVILDPAGWVGKPFPLLKHIDRGEQLSTGKWLVILYRYDCPHCQDQILAFLQEGKEPVQVPAAMSIALIEMPPYADASARPALQPPNCIRGQLTDAKEWIVKPPAIALVADGVVLAARAEPGVDLPGLLRQLCEAPGPTWE